MIRPCMFSMCRDHVLVKVCFLCLSPQWGCHRDKELAVSPIMLFVQTNPHIRLFPVCSSQETSALGLTVAACARDSGNGGGTAMSD